MTPGRIFFAPGFCYAQIRMLEQEIFAFGYAPRHLKGRFCPRIMRIASQERVWFSTKGFRR